MIFERNHPLLHNEVDKMSDGEFQLLQNYIATQAQKRNQKTEIPGEIETDIYYMSTLIDGVCFILEDVCDYFATRKDDLKLHDFDRNGRKIDDIQDVIWNIKSTLSKWVE